MPKFKIVETVREERTVEAETAQDALEMWLVHGTDGQGVSDEFYSSVEEREVLDEDGNGCEVSDG